MTDIEMTLEGAYDRIVRRGGYIGYFPSKDTTEQTDHDFEKDITTLLLNQGYTWTLESDPYQFDDSVCVDLQFAHSEHETDVKITVYRTVVNGGSFKHYFVRVNGNGRRARELWSELRRIENEVITEDD